jgi:flagellar secretion chaperone FliS
MSAPSQEYLKTKVMTASPEMLTLMLWDGAIRFAEQGKQAIAKKDIEGSYQGLVRAQRIITELLSNLKHDVNPELCGQLAALYNFIFRRLVDANMTKEVKLVDDALEIMRHQRETWALLIEKLSKEKAGDSTQATVAANTDATSAEITPATIPTRPPVSVAAPARRTYPAFAVRPAASMAGTMSVQG